MAQSRDTLLPKNNSRNMFCNNCGEQIKEGQKFCTKCGTEAKPRLVGAMKPSTAMPADAKPVPWATKRLKIILWVFGGLIVISILSAIVLASLNTARQKGNEAQQKELGATAVDQTDGWQQYNSVADSFSIQFPEFPTYDSQTDDGGEVAYDYHTYSATKDTTSFQVIKYIYKDEIDVSEPDNLLERYLNGFVNGVGSGTLVSSDYTYASGYRALDFHVSTTDNEDIKGRLILVGQTPYLIAVDYFTQNYNEADYQRFINSFTAK